MPLFSISLGRNPNRDSFGDCAGPQAAQRWRLGSFAGVGAVLFAAVMTTTVVGCGDEPTPSTTWTAADHAQPSRNDVDPARVPQQTPSQPEAPSPQARARAAATLWRLTCAGCHGAEGRGDGAEADAAWSLADLSDPQWQSSHVDEDIARVITLGEGPMPAFGETLAPAGIAALVEHVRSLHAPAAE